jgi:hypothetical protein
MANLFNSLKSKIEDLRMNEKVKYDAEFLEHNDINYKELNMYEKALDDVLNILKKEMGAN